MTGETLPPAVGELLQRCVLEVHTRNVQPGGGSFVGNAFFVHERLVVTCAHVLRDAGGENASLRLPRSYRPADADDPVVIRSVRSHPPDRARTGQYPFPDLAVIHVEPATGTPVDWVLLGHGEPEQGRRVFARGVSRHSSDGAVKGPPSAAGLTLEVASRSAGFLRVRADRVEPGMSGSPVVDPRTGEVIGMVKASRHFVRELGGYVLPAAVIRSCLGDDLDRCAEEEAERRWYQAVRTPVPARPEPRPPAPVRYAARLLIAREWLSLVLVGAALLAGVLGVLVLIVRPGIGFPGLTEFLSLGLVGCATAVLAVAVGVLAGLARWFRALSEGLRRARPGAYRRALRWTVGEVVACTVILLSVPKRPLPVGVAVLLLVFAVLSVVSLRHSTVRGWCGP